MKSSIVLCAVLWHVSATLILASRAADLSTCFACCMEAKDFFAKEKDVERCCRQACEGQGPGGCNMPEEIAFFRIGQQLAENAFDPIRINGILYACFEHPPGTYGFDRGEIPQIQNTIPRNLTYSWYTKADNIPTHLPTTFPSIAPTFDGFSSDPVNGVIVGSATFGAVLGFAALFFFVARRRKMDVIPESPQTSITHVSLQKLADTFGKLTRVRQQSSHTLESRGSLASSSTKMSKESKRSKHLSQEGHAGLTRVLSVVEVEQTIRSGILSYKSGTAPEFHPVNARLYKKSVTRTDRSSFKHFKRISASTIATRESVYFTDYALLDQAAIVDKILRSVEQTTRQTRTEDEFTRGLEPTIPLKAYLLRLIDCLDQWYNNNQDDSDDKKPAGINAVILSMVYQKRMLKSLESFSLTIFNIHKVFAVSMLLAAKYSEDEIITNTYWARVAMISLEELNRIESAFCSALGFNLYVSPEEFKVFSMAYLPSNLKEQEREKLFISV